MTSTGKSAFRRGLIDGLPFVLTGAPFGLVYGLVAGEAGFDFAQSLAMSLVVFGGASQLAALAQLSDGAPALMAIAAGLLVNVRLVIYSASLAPYMADAPLWKRAFAAYLLVDNAYVTSHAGFAARPDLGTSGRYLYFTATALPICLSWMVATVVGSLGGQAIPESYGIGFAVPLSFIALLAPMLRTLAHLAAALVAVVAVLALAPMPYNSELVVAALLGMAAGAGAEQRRGG